MWTKWDRGAEGDSLPSTFTLADRSLPGPSLSSHFLAPMRPSPLLHSNCPQTLVLTRMPVTEDDPVGLRSIRHQRRAWKGLDSAGGNSGRTQQVRGC